MIPTVAAKDSSQASTLTGILVVKPSVCSAQPWATPASHTSTRLRPMPTTMIRTAASPIDFHSTVRNGRVNIWASALNAASSIGAISGAISNRSAEVRGRAAQHKGGDDTWDDRWDDTWDVMWEGIWAAALSVA